MGFDAAKLQKATRARDDLYREYVTLKAQFESKEREVKDKGARLENLKSRLDTTEKKVKKKVRVDRILAVIKEIRELYKTPGPKLRVEVVSAITLGCEGGTTS